MSQNKRVRVQKQKKTTNSKHELTQNDRRNECAFPPKLLVHACYAFCCSPYVNPFFCYPILSSALEMCCAVLLFDNNAIRWSPMSFYVTYIHTFVKAIIIVWCIYFGRNIVTQHKLKFIRMNVHCMLIGWTEDVFQLICNSFHRTKVIVRVENDVEIIL